MTISAFGQKEIFILDSLSRKPIEYANINFIGSDKGTYTNTKGVCEIPIETKEILISSIGYEKKVIYKLSDTIFLSPKVTELPDVVITSNSKSTIGKEKSKLYVGFNSNSKSVIFIKKINLKNNVNLLKAHFDLINNKTPKKFRILLFDVNENNKPNKNVLNKDIISEIKPNEKNIIIGLNDFDINLKKGIYFLGIEIFELTNESKEPPIQIGCYKSSDKNKSFVKPVFNNDSEWNTIKTYNGKKDYSFNFYLSILK